MKRFAAGVGVGVVVGAATLGGIIRAAIRQGDKPRRTVRRPPYWEAAS